MRHFTLLAIALFSSAAESAPRELSPQGQAIFDAYYGKKLVRGLVPKGTADEARELSGRIAKLLAVPNPDMKTIRALVSRHHSLKVQAQEEAFEDMSELVAQLPPADQITYLKKMYPSYLPVVIEPSVRRSDSQVR
jgi:hypothetical protein